MGVLVRILKPTPIIYPAVEKKPSPFIYLISLKVDLFICCSLNLYTLLYPFISSVIVCVWGTRCNFGMGVSQYFKPTPIVCPAFEI